ncbi:zinc finger BED domain-containing protein 5-like [Palaemon carinicauda]|uniref:zinc finger BED domain-containing protein 5-like n=1 Tax=Palaemon carinicauda TaxID=392227 RepID=UPI0035B690AA
MAEFCQEELIRRLKLSQNFSLQVDESTDVAGLAILLVFVCYIHNFSIEEDMLLCKPLKTHTKGEDIVQVIEFFLEEHDISWQNCSSICTNGAAAMVGKYSSVVSRMKNKKGIVHIHCFLHLHALAIKIMPPDLNEVIDDMTKCFNFIKTRPLNSRIFSLLCEDMGSTHKAFLLHNAVRLLSKGKELVMF